MNPKSVMIEGNRIEAKAFYACENLESICIPEGVTYIGDYAFAECRNLKHIVIPLSAIGNIGQHILYQCRSLETMTLFQKCIDMKKVTITEFDSIYEISTGDNILDGYENSGCADFIAFQTEIISALLGNDYADLWHVILTHGYGHSTIFAPEMQMLEIWNDFTQLSGSEFSCYHFFEGLSYLCKFCNPEIKIPCVQSILNSGTLITKDNIDLLIDQALKAQEFEIQIMLMHYKSQHFAFDPDQLKL